MNPELSKPATQRKLSVISFSLFSAWLLSFPFEGQILYILVDNAGIEKIETVAIAIFCHFVGLFSSGFLIKKQVAAKITMVASIVACLAGSLIFFLPFSFLWSISLPVMAFFAGLFVASWAFYFKVYSPPEKRLQTAADVLICSNLIMILINVCTVNLSVFLGLGLSIISLVGAIILTFRLEAQPPVQDPGKMYAIGLPSGIFAVLKPFLILCFFIFIITINSGLMYQVVSPAFDHYPLLTSYYWALPYITVLFILRNLPPRINQAYILYIAMIMIGLAYIGFMWLDRSMISYLLIDTLMLGSFGVCDLFWWSILGSMLDYSENPAQILGIGLSMNVLGILAGDLIGSQIISVEGGYLQASIIALVVIFTVIFLLPILNSQLTRLLKNHAFLVEFAAMKEEEWDKALWDFKNDNRLTEKEMEVVRLLLRGYTYKVISENLFISENTTKYHIKNIYQKLNIKSKMELIRMLTKEEKPIERS